MPTHVSDAAKNRLMNAALFTEATKANTLTNMLTGVAPATADKKKVSGSKQTESGAPIVRVTDLQKSAGDEVTVDLYHQIRQKPVMGDDKIAGKMASLTSSQFTLKVDQARFGVDSGGRMAQKKLKHNLKSLAGTMLKPQVNFYREQMALVHLAGARGDHNDANWLVPTADDKDFARIMVNDVTPPTYDRHAFGGDATSIETLDAADTFSLGAVDNLRLQLEEMAFPLQPIKYAGDPMSDENPFYVLFVTPRQWNDFWISAGADKWRTLVSNAEKRKTEFRHPLFTGDCAMWQNILIKKQKNPIRFNTGSIVDVCGNDLNATVSQKIVSTTVDRAILLGGQALADCFGKAGNKGSDGGYFHMSEETTDHGNVTEHVVAMMEGMKKIRFAGTDGRVNDHGVMCLDTAVSI